MPQQLQLPPAEEGTEDAPTNVGEPESKDSKLDHREGAGEFEEGLSVEVLTKEEASCEKQGAVQCLEIQGGVAPEEG